MRAGRPPTLWCVLISAAGLLPMATLSITSGIKRALRQKIGVADRLERLLENLDEGAADDLALRARAR